MVSLDVQVWEVTSYRFLVWDHLTFLTLAEGFLRLEELGFGPTRIRSVE